MGEEVLVVESGLRYVYCVAACAERRSFGNIGIGAREVYTVPYRGIGAVVSDVKLEPDSDPFDAVDVGEENWMRHDEVVRKVALDHVLVPAKFNSFLMTTYDVGNMLRRLYSECQEELKEFKGMVEIGVKVTWDRENVEGEISKERETIKRVREKLCNVYFLMMKKRVDPLSDAVKMVLDSVEVASTVNFDEYLLKIHYAEELYSALKRCAVDARAHQLLSYDMVLNGSFLAHEGREDFGKGLEEVKRLYEGSGLKFAHSAPFEPYSFTKIKYY